MVPRISSIPDHPLLPDPGRRKLLAGASGLLLGGAVAALTGCAPPPPEEEPFDPRSLVYPPPPETPRFYFEGTLWGSGNVVEVTSADRLQRFATGQPIRGEGFAKPFAVTARGGRVYISDTVARLVHVLDFPGRSYKKIGEKGVGRLAKPLGLTTDLAGNLYVVDNTAKRALIYDPEGIYVTSIGNKESLDRPTAVAVDAQGDRIYILDTGGVNSTNHQVVVYDRRGNVLSRIGGRGSGEGKFNLPLDVTLGPDRKLYVLDSGNFRVQVFRPDGSFDHAFGKAGRYPGQFSHPKAIAIDSAGVVYITDTSFGLFQLFNSEGQVLMAIGERSETPGPGKFILPAGIAVDVDGRIYVVDQFFRKVEVFRPAALPEDWPVGQVVA